MPQVRDMNSRDDFETFTFGHVRQLDKVADEALRRAWHLGAGPGDAAATM